MSIELDDDLATAMEADVRRPRILLLARYGRVEELPLERKILVDDPAVDEETPNVCKLTSGAIAVTYVADDKKLYLGVSDEARTDITFYFLRGYETAEFSTIQSACPVEISADNNIGIVYSDVTGTAGTPVYNVKYLSVSTLGVVEDEGTIYTSETVRGYDPFVIQLLSGTYYVTWATETAGPLYYLKVSTSADFSTWATAADIGLGAFPAVPFLFENPMLFEYESGTLYLLFDANTEVYAGTSIMNVIMLLSGDEGVTWDTAGAATSYDSTDTGHTSGSHPFMVSRESEELLLIFTETSHALKKWDSAQTALHGPDEVWIQDGAAGDALANDIFFDSSSRNLYVVCGLDAGPVQNIVQIDADTWTVTECINTVASSPTLPEVITTTALMEKVGRGDKEFSVFHSNSSIGGARGPGVITLYDGQSNVFRTMAMQDASDPTMADDIECNVDSDYDAEDISEYWYFKAAQADATAERVWLAYYVTFTTGGYGLIVGHIEWGGVTESGSGADDYDFTEMSRQTGIEADQAQYTNGILPIPERGLVFVYPGNNTNTSYKKYYLFNTESGNTYWSNTDPVGDIFLPRYGLRDAAYANGKIYGTVDYYAGSPAIAGLFVFDIDAETYSYKTPTCVSGPDYGLYDVEYDGDHTLIFACTSGLVTYDIDADTWDLTNDTDRPGMSTGGTYNFTRLAFDRSSKTAFLLRPTDDGTFNGVTAINLNGEINRTIMLTGTGSVGSWSWDDGVPFTEGLTDRDAVVLFTPNFGDASSMEFLSVWSFDTANGSGIAWGQEGDVNLSPLLVGNVVTRRSIDGSPARLDFQLANGHLFDRYNTGSLYAEHLKMGRQLLLYFGEEMSDGSTVWQKQGTFYVQNAAPKIGGTHHPRVSVTAECYMGFWDEHVVQVTEYFDAEDPEDAIRSLLVAHGGLESSDISIPDFVSTSPITAQWVDTELQDILEEFIDRFHYYTRMNVDGVLEMRRFLSPFSTDHSYEDSSTDIEVSPDSKEGDFTNTFVCKGESATSHEEYGPEEAVNPTEGVSITFPGYGHVAPPPLDYDFSDGVERWGNFRHTTDYNYYSVFASGLFTAICPVTFTVGDEETWYRVQIQAPAGGPATLGTYSLDFKAYASKIEMVYGTVQSSITATDETMRDLVDFDIVEVTDDPLVFTESDAIYKTRAMREQAQLERASISIKKVVHLQDEDGDVIRVRHPISGEGLSVFITDIKRTYPVGDRVGGAPSKKGPTDEIDGWVVGREGVAGA